VSVVDLCFPFCRVWLRPAASEARLPNLGGHDPRVPLPTFQKHGTPLNYLVPRFVSRFFPSVSSDTMSARGPRRALAAAR